MLNCNRNHINTFILSDPNQNLSNSLNFVQNFFHFSIEFHHCLCFVRAWFIICRYHWSSVETKNEEILKKSQLLEPCIHMAVWEFFEPEHCWAKEHTSFIFLIITRHLFQPIQSKFARNQKLHLQEVRIQPLQFLKLWYGFGRSFNIEYTATWIVQIHWLLMKISGFICLIVKTSCARFFCHE